MWGHPNSLFLLLCLPSTTSPSLSSHSAVWGHWSDHGEEPTAHLDMSERFLRDLPWQPRDAELPSHCWKALPQSVTSPGWWQHPLPHCWQPLGRGRGSKELCASCSNSAFPGDLCAQGFIQQPVLGFLFPCAPGTLRTHSYGLKWKIQTLPQVGERQQQTGAAGQSWGQSAAPVVPGPGWANSSLEQLRRQKPHKNSLQGNLACIF